MDDLIIREVLSQDIPTLGELNTYLIQDEGHQNTMDIPALRRRMAGWLKHEYRCFVVVHDETIVGYALFKTVPAGFYLRQLFVTRTYRRKGIATQLLDFLFAEVWQGSELRLDVLTTNNQAIAFYERYGLALYCHTFRREAIK